MYHGRVPAQRAREVIGRSSSRHPKCVIASNVAASATRAPVAKGAPSASREHRGLVADMPQSTQLTVQRQGQYAGAVSRFAAIAMDCLASWAIYVTAGALVTFAVELFTTSTFALTEHPVGAVTALVIWEFTYFSYQWAISGRTIGMALSVSVCRECRWRADR